MAMKNQETDQFASRLLSQWEQMKSDRKANFDTLYEEIALFVKPSRVGFNTEFTPGTKLTGELMDSTAPDASQKLAFFIHGALVSSTSDWFGLDIKGAKLSNAGKRWMEANVALEQEAFADSNWDAASEEAIEDAVDFGIGAIWSEERSKKFSRGKKGFRGLRFEALHPNSYWFEIDEEGNPAVIYRLVQMSARAAKTRWGDELSEKILKGFEKEPQKLHDFLLVVEPRADVPKSFRNKTPKNRPFASFWIDVEGKKLLEEGGYFEFPCAIFPWSRASGEIRGRGPVMTALPDIRTLNKAEEFGLKAWAKVIDPPMKRRRRGVEGSVHSKPGGITTVRNMEDLEPLYPANAFRFDVSEIKQANKKASIEKILFVDQIQLPPLRESKTMSATEIERRFEQATKILGSAFGRIKNEGIGPVVKRSFFIMLRAKAFGPIPEGLDKELLQVSYKNPFERAQKQSDVVSTERFLTDVTALAQTSGMEGVMDRIDQDGVVEVLHEGFSAPSKVLRSKTDAQKARATRQEAQAEQERLDQAEQGSQTLKNVGGGRGGGT